MQTAGAAAAAEMQSGFSCAAGAGATAVSLGARTDSMIPEDDTVRFTRVTSVGELSIHGATFLWLAFFKK